MIKYKGYIQASTESEPNPQDYDTVPVEIISYTILTDRDIRTKMIKETPKEYCSFGENEYEVIFADNFGEDKEVKL